MSATPWTLPEQFDEYRLIRMVGRGNMGVVFLGHDLVLDRPVAIKFLNNVDADARARERFLTEARAAARIHHPNVMAIYRVGELEGRLYIISEYIRGVSLHELKRPIPWREALRLGVGLARGLACAHRQGVLHRDIKLANAMRSESGEVKLLDFSLAKLQAAADPAGPRAGGPELDRAGDPELGAGLPRVTIDAGTRAGRTVDSTLTRVPGVAPSKPEGDLDSTLTRVDAPADVQTRPRLDLSDDAVVGTPYYMAPELWRAEPASRTSDVYALGVLLYLLCSGQPPIDGKSAIELARKAQEVAPTPLHSLVPGLDRRFGEIVDRCLKFSPRDRYASGDELCTALEMLEVEGAAAASGVKGNPYRGLQAFEARHRNVFFGRGAEIRAAVDRLRGEPFLLVAGDSGVGKSSLCRAGVLPVFCEQASDGRAWATISVMPGRRPLQTLASALANHAGIKEDLLRELFETDPAEILRTLARRHGKDHGLVLFVDQLEEMVTLAEPHQVPLVGRFLAELASGVPGLRLLATARGDFLTRVAALPEVGRYINLAIYLLTPLTREGVREAIVGPARMQEVEFESDALVETLATAGVEGNLPLLQFALAELWEARDPATRKISSADLERIGRVTGALARHADNVVAELPAGLRGAVRRLLMRLVTIEDTRASLPLADLVLGDPNNETALEALVRGRLVVAREAQDGTVYEIAHEALIRNWGTLQRWITEEREARETYHRLETAALEWQRLGSARVGLWTTAQLAETSRIDAASLRPRERAFLAASRAHELRLRRLRVIVAVSVPAVLLLIYIGLRVQQSRELGRRVEAQLAQADTSLAEARTRQEETVRLRAQAFERFDAPSVAEAEEVWAAARAAALAADRQYRRAVQEYELALNLDPALARAREGLLAGLFERALAAESASKQELADELVERLAGLEGQAQLERWRAPGSLSLVTTPPVTAVLERYERDPDSLQWRPTALRALGATPIDLELEPGSYRLRLAAPAGEIAYPLVVRRSERRQLALTLPGADEVPPGFVYVPEGRFRFGTADDELLRRFFITVPEHDVATGAYLIARHETTYAEWIAYLEDLPVSERRRVLDSAKAALIGSGIILEQGSDGTWSLAITAGDLTYIARQGEILRYAARTHDAEQDWLRMPATTIDWTQANAYAAWLDRSGRVPGARLCTEREWERAARGADGRKYPHADRLAPEDANTDVTYGKIAATSGPDTVGTHPASRSPFGVDDMVGNVFEWVESSLEPGTPVARGGSFAYDDVVAGSINRAVVPPELQDAGTGVRICATPRSNGR